MNLPSEQNFPSAAVDRSNQPNSALGEAAGPGSVHKVSGIYPSRAEAEVVRQILLDSGVAASDIAILHETLVPAAGEPVGEEGSDEVLKDVVVDGVIGTAVGTGVGALGTAMMVAANVTLFVASPVIAPLAMLGWFAGVGGILGAAAGANSRQSGKFSELVSDAIHAGNTVLIANTHNETQREQIKKIINDSFKGRDEVAIESS